MRNAAKELRIFYSPAYASAAHEFATTRKARWVAKSLADEPIAGVRIHEPRPVAEADLLGVHTTEYVRAVRDGEPRALAESNDFPWDPGIWPMVLASNGGAVAAARSALTDGVAGSLSSGLHHARRDMGNGFCTFNGLVLAARAALDAGAAEVLILDLDAHCGGGTASLIADEPRLWQVDVSVARFDGYTSSDRSMLTMVNDAASYLPTIARELEKFEARAPRPALCIYNAGMDPCESCDTGGLAGVTREILADRERLVFEWCRSRGIPVAFVLAGGYTGRRLDEAGLVALHRQTIAAAR